MSDNGFAEGLACGQGMNGGYGCGGGFGYGGDWIALIFLAAIFGGGGWGGGRRDCGAGRVFPLPAQARKESHLRQNAPAQTL